jgi:archaellum component FlaC
MSEIAQLEKKMDKQFDNLTALMSNFANDVNERFDKIEARLDQHDKRFDALDEKFNKLLDTIDGLVKRIDDYETELAARDHKIERLERWIEQLASNAGVKLS